MKNNEAIKRVLILMSTFNGGEEICRQVESILKQKKVNVFINIRDDGSDLSTQRLLYRLKNLYPDKISLIVGSNIGWKKSFLELIKLAGDDYDYYGFSDQDDLWLDDKISQCINIMEGDRIECPKLAHCNCISVDEKMNIRSEQETRMICPKSFKMAISTEYFQGCGMLWNKKAMRLLQQYYPKNVNLAHDYWVGLICYLFGKIYFCPTPLFYHIRYANNSSSDGSRNEGKRKRISSFFKSKSVYMNPSKDLLCGYHDLLNKSQTSFLNKCSLYRRNFIFKMSLIFDLTFRRPSFFSTIFFKFAILFNKF